MRKSSKFFTFLFLSFFIISFCTQSISAYGYQPLEYDSGTQEVKIPADNYGVTYPLFVNNTAISYTIFSGSLVSGVLGNTFYNDSSTIIFKSAHSMPGDVYSTRIAFYIPSLDYDYIYLKVYIYDDTMQDFNDYFIAFGSTYISGYNLVAGENNIILDVSGTTDVINNIYIRSYRSGGTGDGAHNLKISVAYIRALKYYTEFEYPCWTKNITITHTIIMPTVFNSTHNFLSDYIQELWILVARRGVDKFGLLIYFYAWDKLIIENSDYLLIVSTFVEDFTWFNMTVDNPNYVFSRKVADSTYEVKIIFQIIASKLTHPIMDSMGLNYILGCKAYGGTSPNLVISLLEATLAIFPPLIIVVVIPIFFYTSFNKSMKALGFGFFASGILFISVSFGHILINMLSIIIGFILLFTKKEVGI